MSSDADELARVDATIGLERGEVGDAVVGRIAVADHTRGPAGGLRTGVLLTAVDAVGGLACGLASLPAWIVSTNLMVRVARLDHTGPLRLDARVLRIGAAAGVAAVDVRDEGAADRHVAHGILTAGVLAPDAGPPRLSRPVHLTPLRPAEPGPLEQSFGIDEGTGATTTLQVRDGLRNRWGILHGGAVAMLADVAATRAVGSTGVTADTVLHFLRPVRTGPVEARCTIAGRRPDATVVIIAMHDLGNAGRQVALASVSMLRGAAGNHPRR